MKKRFSVHLYAGAYKEESLWKHLGDLGACTPFSCATESLGHCDEPNWAEGPDLVCLNSWVQDSGIGTSESTLQDRDLVCGPESCRGSLDSQSLQCQWSVWKRRVKTSDENPDERRRSCEPLIWVGFIHICIFFLNSWEQCLFKTLGYFDQRSRGTTSALLLLKWCGEGNSCLCWNRLSPTSGKLRFNPKQTGSWSWLSWTFCWRKVLRKTNLHVET